jgi:hypothetical protein
MTPGLSGDLDVLNMNILKLIGLLGPIIGLLVLGLFLTAKSGVMQLQSGPGWRQAAENLSQAILLIAGCLIGMAVVQQLVGFCLELW